MKELKIKAPNTILHDKQLKLYDFIEDFVEIESKTFLDKRVTDFDLHLALSIFKNVLDSISTKSSIKS